LLFRQERDRFRKQLEAIPGLRVIPSQANYITVQLTGGITARGLTRQLLLRHNLFIKDLSPKLKGGQYVRLAIRDTKDNDKLIAALKQELSL